MTIIVSQLTTKSLRVFLKNLSIMDRCMHLSGTNIVKGDTSLTVQAGSRIVSVTGGDFSVKASDAVLMKGSGKGVGIEGSGGAGVEIKGKGSDGVGISGNPNFVAVGETEDRVYSKDVLVHADTS